MNNEINIQSGERLSFYKLFSENAYHIEVPIIQRDYAQGRKSSSEVRTTFLDALYDYLKDNKPNRDLDFVYGSISITNNGCSKFIPLDGQQRLTTLFLLHWYLAISSKNTDDFRNVLAYKDDANYKSKFTYETRTSSREFCDELMTNEIDLQNLLPADKDKNNSLSKTIQNCGWYYLSWENDPTIKSMLTMLDDIHKRFKGCSEFYARLTDTENPVITFLFLNLSEFKLTDDLYIKMNARGKPLTTFENFKAKFEQHIGKLNWGKKDQRDIVFDDIEKNVAPKEYFAHKIDTTWANLLWHYRKVNSKKGKNDNSYDDELMHFIRVIMANECASKSEKDKNPNLEFLIGTDVAKKRDDYTDDLTFHKFESFKILTKDAISYLINALDALSNGDSKIHKHLATSYYYNEDETFKIALRHELSSAQRVQFHAYLKFLIAHKTDRTGIYQWMRVTHNLTENRNFDSADDIAKATKVIDTLIPVANQILDELQKEKTDIGFFVGRQVQEERIKAHLITLSDEWKTAIEIAEQHPYFKGQIGFMLEFSEILAYYERYKNCSWGEIENTTYLKSFKAYSEKARAIFTIIQKSSADIDYLWERAVLSKGDYFIGSSASRKNMLSTTKNTRDYSWKRLLRIQPDKDKEALVWIEKRKFVKEVFDDNRFNCNDVLKSLSDICKSSPNDWRKYFIENPKLIGYCKQGYIRFRSKSDIKLFKESQQNHYQKEFNTTVLYYYLKSGKTDISPFSDIVYEPVKSGDDFSYVEISGFTHIKTKYCIAIYYTENDKDFLPNPFQFVFYKPSNNKEDKYHQEIKDILKAYGIEWKEDNEGFWTSVNSSKEVIDLIENLCTEFNSL